MRSLIKLMKEQRQFPVQKLTTLGLLTALALAIYGLEAALPVPYPIPGFRLGLSNIITLAVLRRYGFRDSALVLLARILLGALLFGQILSLLYSAVGGFLCLLAEAGLERLLQKRYLYLTGSAGGMIHNLGQILVAILLTGSVAPLVYLPYLIPLGILTGLFMGLCSHFLLQFLQKL